MVYKKRILVTIVTFLIIIMPITNSYASLIPNIGVGELALLFIIPIWLIDAFTKKYHIRIDTYWLFVVYGISISLLVLMFNSNISAYDVTIRLFRDLFYVFVIFIVAQNLFDIRFATRLYKFLTIVACVLIFIQCISFYIFNITLPWLVPQLPLNYIFEEQVNYINHYRLMYQQVFRPTSFFLEPAYFAQFAAPGLVMFLFPTQNENTSLKYALFVSIAMILSTSANAYALVLVIWMIWYIREYRNKKTLKQVMGLFGIMILVIGSFLIAYKKVATFQLVIDRFIYLGSNNDDYSANIRVLKGILIYSQLGILYQIFGIGFGSYETFAAANSISTIYDVTIKYMNVTIEYMNTLAYILVSTGIVGLFIYGYTMYKIFKGKDIGGKMMIIIYTVMSLSSSIYSSPVYIIILVFALHWNDLKIIPKNLISQDRVDRKY